MLPVHDAASGTVVRIVVEAFRRLPHAMAKSLTWDRGTEMTRHTEFSWATSIPVYFCDAHSPWQCGSNENTKARRRSRRPASGRELRVYAGSPSVSAVHALPVLPRRRGVTASGSSDLLSYGILSTAPLEYPHFVGAGQSLHSLWFMHSLDGATGSVLHRLGCLYT